MNKGRYSECVTKTTTKQHTNRKSHRTAFDIKLIQAVRLYDEMDNKWCMKGKEEGN